MTARVNVVYLKYNVVTYYPEIVGNWVTLHPMGEHAVEINVRTRQHGNIVRSIYFNHVITINREFSDD